MSKDNREECTDCLGHGREIDGEQQRRICEKCIKDYGLGGYHVDCVDCLTSCCATCNGTGEVTIDSGADVCHWVCSECENNPCKLTVSQSSDIPRLCPFYRRRANWVKVKQ